MNITATTLPGGEVRVVVENNGVRYSVEGSPIVELEMSPPELPDITDWTDRIPSRAQPAFTLRLEHIRTVTAEAVPPPKPDTERDPT